MSAELQPLLVRISTRDLVVAPIRFGAAAIVLGTAARVDSVGAAVREAALGAVLFTIFLVVTESGKRRRLGPVAPSPPPAGARYASVGEAARIGVYPSTIGVSALALAALFVDARLAALLAGVLAAMGAAALALGGRALWIEHRDCKRLLVSRTRPPRLYVTSAD
jgi:hypothetical protein